MTEFKSIKELEEEIKELKPLQKGEDLDALDIQIENFCGKLEQTQAIIKLIDDKIKTYLRGENSFQGEALLELKQKLKGET